MNARVQKQTRKRTATKIVSASLTSDRAVSSPREDVDIVRMARAEIAARNVEKHAMIAEAAYYRAEKRGFEPGRELEDWLAAESDIADVLLRTELLAG